MFYLSARQVGSGKFPLGISIIGDSRMEILEEDKSLNFGEKEDHRMVFIEDFIGKKACDHQKKAYYHLCKKLRRFISSLSSDERKIIRIIFFQNKGIVEAAIKCHMTTKEAQAVKRSAIMVLREKISQIQ